MGLKKVKNFLINEDKYVYPYPELVIQSTRNVYCVPQLGSDLANNDNGYIYFYADSDWKKNPNVYIGESKNSIQSRHNATHKNTEWFNKIKYPFIGIINSHNLPWDTDTRRAIESKTVYKLHTIGINVVNGVNSTWVNGGTVHPNVNNQYVEDVSDIIVDYILHHIGYISTHVSDSIVKVNASQSLDGDGRDAWVSKANPNAVKIMDTVFKWATEQTNLDIAIKYNTSYIGMSVNGKAHNFLGYNPSKKNNTCAVSFRVPNNKSNPFIQNILYLEPKYTSWGDLQITFDLNDMQKHESDIRGLIEEAISYLNKNGKEKSATKNPNRSYASHGVKLVDLLKAELIKSGTVINTISYKYPAEAVVNFDGTITWKDEIYDSLSTSGGAVIKSYNPNVSPPNGWTFWGIKQPDGSIKTLASYRTEYDNINK